MRRWILGLAGAALAVTAASQAVAGDRRAHPARAPKAGEDAIAPAARLPEPTASAALPAVAVAAAPALSADARRVADWVAASADNQGLPYIIVDKKGAQLLLYGEHGELLDEQPVLLGMALGDQSTPGVGSKDLAQIGTAEKTTPAGRFLARFGLAAGRRKVLWVDYANSVALHPIPATVSPNEHRRERLLSPGGEDNRITFGCINVPRALYSERVVPLFRKQGGYVYVLPDQLALDDVFPLLRMRPIDQALNAPRH